MMRLDKYLAGMGAGTRQEIKKAVRQGRVTVNGSKAERPDMKVEEERDLVCLDGTAIKYAALEYYMLNKPAGVVSATEDRNCKTVLDLITVRKRKDLFPVGRLDKDTEGLLLITNDGALAHRLLTPGKHVDKTYLARIKGKVTQKEVRQFLEGLDIGTEQKPECTMPAVLEILESGEESRVRITIQEGKYHQIKRMFQAVGMEVLYLKRERMGLLVLDPELETGAFRPLTKKEIEDVTNTNVE